MPVAEPIIVLMTMPEKNVGYDSDRAAHDYALDYGERQAQTFVVPCPRSQNSAYDYAGEGACREHEKYVQGLIGACNRISDSAHNCGYESADSRAEQDTYDCAKQRIFGMFIKHRLLGLCLDGRDKGDIFSPNPTLPQRGREIKISKS